MKRLWAATGVFFFFLTTSGSSQAAERLRAVSGGFGSAIHAVLWVADSRNLFQKYGLEVEYIAISSGTVAMQTVLAGETQIDFSTGALAITANLEGADVTIIAGGLNFFPYNLIARPPMRSPEDIKGKTMAISRFGSATEYAAHAALQKIGLTANDVKIIQVGGNTERFAALVSGAVQTAMLIEPQSTMAIKNFAMNSLIDMAATGTPFPQNSFMVKRSYLAANHDKVVRFMKGAIEGLYVLKRDKKLALQLIKKYLRVEEEDAAIGYDYYIDKYGEGILSLPAREGMQFVISQIANRNPKAKGQTPENLKLLDPSVLQEIKKSGFVEKVKH